MAEEATKPEITPEEAQAYMLRLLPQLALIQNSGVYVNIDAHRRAIDEETFTAIANCSHALYGCMEAYEVIRALMLDLQSGNPPTMQGLQVMAEIMLQCAKAHRHQLQLMAEQMIVQFPVERTKQ